MSYWDECPNCEGAVLNAISDTVEKCPRCGAEYDEEGNLIKYDLIEDIFGINYKVRNVKRILITGVAGFVGHHLLEAVLKTTDWEIVGLARLNHAGDMSRISNIDVLKEKEYADRVSFVYHDLKYNLNESIREQIGEVDYIAHLGSNSHVDRSITHPKDFFLDNVIGAVNLLEYTRKYMKNARFLNFGTDEVFGAAPQGYNFKENDRYRPSNPYSASKAGQICAGHSYFVTYGLDIISTYTMNIFGERQHPEKLVAMSIGRIMNDIPIQIHSKLDKENKIEYVGERHWLHARNAADAVIFLLKNGKAGEHYNVVGDTELKNDELVKKIGEIIGKKPQLEYVDFHNARPGHDRRYALDGSKLEAMGWKPPLSFEKSLVKTIRWELTK